MKKNKQRIVGIVATLAVCAGIAVIGMTMGKEKAAVIMDSHGEEIAKLTYQEKEMLYSCKDGYESYIDLVCKEVVNLLEKQENCTKAEAQKKIVEEELQITTFFDKASFQILKETYEKSPIANQKNYAAGISDVQGHLKASYSFHEGEEERNNLLISTYAGSTIKPLTAYAPGIEEKKISWSTMYEDSPYTQYTDEDGNLSDWPINTKPYTNEMVTVEEALKESNNAVAVKALKDFGVEKACEYLEEKFRISVEAEKKIIQEEGEEKILGNLALGYLKGGVTIPQMISAYTAFANGGIVYPCRTVQQIQMEGDRYYEKEADGISAFSEETAFIMNRLLKHVVEDGGTGKDAQVKGLDICGKTGTSTKFLNNWFIGITPQYVCAVWYEADENSYMRNETVPIFRSIMEEMPNDLNKRFPEATHVEKRNYCKKTGLLATEYCEEQAEGYYHEDSIPIQCNCSD